MSSIQLFTLSNGVRILVESVSYVGSASVGLWCKTGSRHEHADEAGITHLIEHMLFKGTKHRSAKQIAESIEGRGGSLNAFTDKESTCYYARTLKEDAVNAIDVLTDMMLNSLIEPEELAREQGVVLEEIKRSRDEPSDHVHELHLEARWAGHALGLPIIGTPESVSSFRQENLVNYMKRQYRAENVLLSVAGHVDPEVIRAAAEERLGGLPTGVEERKLERPTGAPGDQYEAQDVEQVHFCIGTDGCSYHDPEYHAIHVMDAAMGGNMSSRLFQEIRERRGLAYSVGSYTLNYSAGGAYTVYGGTSAEQWPLVQELVRTEFDKLMKEGLTEDELERTKRNLSGHMVLAQESMSSRMIRMSRNQINFGREIPLEESLEKLEAVTNAQIQSLANRILGADQISTTAIGPAR